MKGEMKMAEEKIPYTDGGKEISYVEFLGKVMDLYENDPGPAAYAGGIGAIFSGIGDDESVPVPMRSDGDSFRPMILGDDENNPDSARRYVVMTDMEELKGYTFANIKLRSLINGIQNFTGRTGRDCYILINPHREHPFEIPFELIQAAFYGVTHWVNDDSRDDGEQDCDEPEVVPDPESFSISVQCSRHITDSQLEGIGILIEGLREKAYEHVILELTESVTDSDGEEDTIEFIQVCRADKGLYHLEIAYNMDEFDWKCPLILADEVEYETAMDIIMQICKDGISSGDIDYIYNHFKAIQVDDSDDEEEDDEEEEEDEE